MGKIKRAKTPDGPREQSPVAKAAAVSALRETLRISEAANASERRESARRLSQQAHRFATSEDGLGIERVQIEADVRVRRVLNALRDKDDQLATAHRRIEDLENQLDLSREECAKLKERCLGLEDSLQAKKQELSHSEAVSTQRKMEGARIKGLLADCRFDLDLLGSKYERLLDERATIGLSRATVPFYPLSSILTWPLSQLAFRNQRPALSLWYCFGCLGIRPDTSCDRFIAFTEGLRPRQAPDKRVGSRRPTRSLGRCV